MALIIAFPLVLLARDKRAAAIAFVAFFSVLPDFIHLGSLRLISHSLIGLAVMLALTLGLLWVLFRPKVLLLAIGAFAALAHLAADLFIGTVYPYYPLSTKYLGMYSFNSSYDVMVEVVLMGVAMILVLAFLRPGKTLRSVRSFKRPERLNLLALLVPFGLMVALEGGYFLLFSSRTQVGLLRGALLLDFAMLFLGSALLVLIALAGPHDRPTDPGLGGRGSTAGRD